MTARKTPQPQHPRYYPSYDTSLRRTFARIRRQQKEAPNVQPLKTKPKERKRA